MKQIKLNKANDLFNKLSLKYDLGVCIVIYSRFDSLYFLDLIDEQIKNEISQR